MINSIAMLAQAGGGDKLWGMIYNFGPFIIFAVMIIFLLRAPKKERERRAMMLEKLKTGDKIITAGGIYGIITNVKEKSFVVKIADNVKIEVSRASIGGPVDKDDNKAVTPS